ncbi:hypothetical protein CLF_107499 [Clonorchis sinensis]|uniref:Uncharacterized protein n=1 Tax=Clonorchis sinensis TaxID=79923 RepID=G7YQM9_CLOSI|nr:hypothetical protein CLF_107499 [Clonorchis sinensis]
MQSVTKQPVSGNSTNNVGNLMKPPPLMVHAQSSPCRMLFHPAFTYLLVRGKFSSVTMLIMLLQIRILQRTGPEWMNSQTHIPPNKSLTWIGQPHKAVIVTSLANRSAMAGCEDKVDKRLLNAASQSTMKPADFENGDTLFKLRIQIAFASPVRAFETMSTIVRKAPRQQQTAADEKDSNRQSGVRVICTLVHFKRLSVRDVYRSLELNDNSSQLAIDAVNATASIGCLSDGCRSVHQAREWALCILLLLKTIELNVVDQNEELKSIAIRAISKPRKEKKLQQRADSKCTRALFGAFSTQDTNYLPLSQIDLKLAESAICGISSDNLRTQWISKPFRHYKRTSLDVSSGKYISLCQFFKTNENNDSKEYATIARHLQFFLCFK